MTEAPPATPLQRRLGYAAIVLLAYVPLLFTEPGKVVADTKSYLYIDPARVLGRAASMWDSNIGFGTVTHQNIGYLFPMGPWYYAFNAVHVPMWVSQRLWLGTIIVFAGFGVLYLARTLAMRGPGVPVAVLLYMFSPYSLHYASRISVLLGPWAALPWMIGLTYYALRDGGWRYPAIFALVVQLVGGVNATALIFAGLGPVLWIMWELWGSHETTWRRALSVTLRIGGLTLVTSLWWMAGLNLQGSYGLDILNYTETVKAVSRTSTPNEILRGLGYWFFYGRDRLGPWIESAVNYTQRPRIILTGYMVSVLALFAAALVRWRNRGFFIVMAMVGVVIGVGAYPYGSPTPLGGLFKSFANSSSAGLALRSTGRAIPLVILSLAMVLGAGVTALSSWMLANVRFSRYALLPSIVIGAAILSAFPALYDGTYYGKNLERPEQIPKAWQQTAAHLNAEPHSTRVLEEPGADFASYNWGSTVDPITPGMMDRPYVARELIPYGSPPSADLLNSLDHRIQEGVLDPAGLVDVLRRAGIGEVVLRNDIQWERYNLVRPRELEDLLASVPQLKVEAAYGPLVSPNVELGITDERTLNPAEEATKDPHEVVVLHVPDQTPIVHADSAQAPVIIGGGDGEGFIDASDAGLLAGNGVVLPSAAYEQDPAQLRKLAGSNATLVLTDESRKRAERWSSVLENLGYTEQAGEKPLEVDTSDQRLQVFPGADDNAYTTVRQEGVKSVQATSYGNAITYTPEDRPAMAFDNNLNTGWHTGAFGQVVGERIQAELLHPITTDQIGLVQTLHGPRDRSITKVHITFDKGPPIDATLDPVSRTPTGQTIHFPARTFSRVSIQISGTNEGGPLFGGESAVGFEEIRIADEHTHQPVRVHEVTILPTDLLKAFGASSLSHPLVVTFNRQRVREEPPRTDPETNLDRQITLPTARSFSLEGDAHVYSLAVQPRQIDAVLGQTGSTRAWAHQFLQGCLTCRGASAFDGNPKTAWTTLLNASVNQWVTIERNQPFTVNHLDLSIVADSQHELPTKIEVQVDNTTRHVTLPAIPRGTKLGSLAHVHLSFPAMTGRHFRLTILGVAVPCKGGATQPPVGCTHTYYAGDALLQLPVAIAEIGGVPVSLAPLPKEFPSTCTRNLVQIDPGTPQAQKIPVRIVGSTADALASKTMHLELCGGVTSIHLSAGTHELVTASESDTAIGIDRLVLASAAGGAATPVSAVAAGTTTAPSSPQVPTITTGNGRTSFNAKVTNA
ncbi:MAG TPA: alpha-(1-_3)-arabinofuranosyltransferase family protein, partial [Acidimicrobiia bacterium]